MGKGYAITPQIEAAIHVAHFHIAIFSKNYAESRWCLDELVLMLKSRATILPIFFNVEPSQLRWVGEDNDGWYAEALRNHQRNQRHDFKTIQTWRESLSRVAEISGFELKKYNGDEGHLLDDVVQHVVKMEGLNTPLLYAIEHPTGLKENLQGLESTVLLQQHSGKAKVVGVVGPGGIGKSTLAKHYFNLNRTNYKRSCFLFDIREIAARGNLISLQSKLLKELTQLDLPIHSIDEGKERLRRHLLHSHTLIILDDVDHTSQLDAFSPLQDVLASNSLILITSRDKQVLRGTRISDKSIYKIAVLNMPHSLELFCLYAFSQPHPPQGFEDLVDGFLTACDGLPLSLKVFGALLYEENDKSHWQEQLNRLHRTLPEDIEKCLRISYDSLTVEEQEIFLDIACFFIGYDKDTAIRIWDSVGFRNLQNKCLLEVDNENKIKMHDHLRDLGRNIAEERSMPARLWRSTTSDIDGLLEQSSSAIAKVRGITMVSRFNVGHLYSTVESPLLCSKMPWYKKNEG